MADAPPMKALSQIAPPRIQRRYNIPSASAGTLCRIALTSSTPLYRLVSPSLLSSIVANSGVYVTGVVPYIRFSAKNCKSSLFTNKWWFVYIDFFFFWWVAYISLDSRELPQTILAAEITLLPQHYARVGVLWTSRGYPPHCRNVINYLEQ